MMSEKVDAVIRRYVPKWKVIDKRDSKFHSFIGKLFPEYMASYATTIGFTSAFPTGAKYDWRTRIHEGQHGRQCMKWSRVGMSALYILPQLLAVLGPLLALIFWNPWFLSLLLFLAPLPAYFRMKFELEAYKITIMVFEWSMHSDSTIYFDSILKNFTGLPYYMMWPLQKDMLLTEFSKARNLALVWNQLPSTSKDPYIEDMYQLIKEQGYLKGKNAT